MPRSPWQPGGYKAGGDLSNLGPPPEGPATAADDWQARAEAAEARAVRAQEERDAWERKYEAEREWGNSSEHPNWEAGWQAGYKRQRADLRAQRDRAVEALREIVSPSEHYRRSDYDTPDVPIRIATEALAKLDHTQDSGKRG